MNNPETDLNPEKEIQLEAGGDCPSAPCSASFEIFELRDFAFRALPKKELLRLLTLVGVPPMKSIDRQRDRMALRLARYADRVTISVQWDSRMPNAGAVAPPPQSSASPETAPGG